MCIDKSFGFIAYCMVSKGYFLICKPSSRLHRIYDILTEGIEQTETTIADNSTLFFDNTLFGFNLLQGRKFFGSIAGSVRFL